MLGNDRSKGFKILLEIYQHSDYEKKLQAQR